MKQTRKRISIILAVCMLITMLPVTAYAETGKSDDTITQTVKPYVISTLTTGAAITVGTQEGVLYEGVESADNEMFSHVTYRLETENIGEGTYNATVDNLPTGVSMKGTTVNIDYEGKGTFELAGNTATAAGTTEGLTLTIKGGSLPEDGVKSGPFELTIIDKEFMETIMELFIKSLEIQIPYEIIGFLHDKSKAYVEVEDEDDFEAAIEDALEEFMETGEKFKDYFDDESLISKYLKNLDGLIVIIDELLEEYKDASDKLADAAKPFFKDEAWEYAQLKYEVVLLSMRINVGLQSGKIDENAFDEIENKIKSAFTEISTKYNITDDEDAISNGNWETLVAFYTEVYDFLYGVLEEYGIVGGITKEYYGLTVGGVRVSSENCGNIKGKGIDGSGTVSYNPHTKTLTLDNAEIAVIDNPTDGYYIGAAIEVYGGIENLTIELKGSSQIGNKPADQGESEDYTVYYGIISDNNITVQGSGSLTIYDRAQGISAENITIDAKGTITIMEHGEDKSCCLKAGGTLEIKNGTLELSSIVSNCLYGDEIIISGGTITAESFDEWDVELYAFNTAPTFASGYKYKVYAGEDKDSAKEVTNHTAATFTTSKYVKIVPVTSGGKDDDDDNGGGRDKDTSPATPTVPTPPAETSKKPVEQVLNDVGTHWALDSIRFVYNRGIMTGTSAEQFSPDARMNRGMLITALGRLAGINALDFTSGSFNDVDMSSYYGSYAEWSLRSNITMGTGNNSFSPDNPVTREELAVILVNFAKAMRYYLPSGEGAQSFADGSTISPWAMEAIEIMRSANIMQGDPDNNFNPKAPATRAEIAAVLQRFIEYMGL
ncbi:S-layer homology domain-containing protein [Sedimentibacter hydroxybenzoicus DSM 7310]|uniref:S-layer homology domain-containing protein n=1 Tax=Sedimentibacter hydroxybenzoicus DSM 7310 TaxID=1123245 RepID=A0A974GWS4_SEDHY|nr:S-layer homology domain-containing protein [Sedimentibacter hydroxybenzoicus]NYB74799.1 S-layer homology domain-containing protein [Sedimentibacter hydroxybenzoicus DSM 7310]